MKQGQVEAGLAAYQAGARDAPDDDENAAGLLFSSIYSDRLSPEDTLAMHKRRMATWRRRRPPAASFANAPEPDRKLRIGYLSPDFKEQHPVGILLKPILTHHDRDRFEHVCCASIETRDESSRLFEHLSQTWHDVFGWNDERLASQIRADGIDILIDLAGHTSGSRIRVLRNRPAPIQACFIGYPHSTGLDAVDYLIADSIVCPPELDHLCSETVLRLDHCVFCFVPNEDRPAVDVEAASRREAVTFGSFNNVPKLTPTTVAIWSEILTRLPDARLKLKAGPFADADTRERFWRSFEDQGVVRDRITLARPTPLAEMMREYGDIDIGLDPIPYNGGITTCQALSMGVPVVTLKGGSFCRRMGASILTRIGLDALIAETREAYVEAAVALAQDHDRRLALRASLRERLTAAPMCDPEAYTRNLERMYRHAWRRWCRKRTTGGTDAAA